MKKISTRLVLRWVMWLLAAAIMVTLFTLSAQPGAASEQTSGGLIYNLIMWLHPDAEAMSAQDINSLVDTLQAFVRKAAHFTAFAALGCSVSSALLTHYIGQKRRFIISELICILYAVLDEIHQIFVPERGPMISDVLIDSLGATIGTILTLLILGKIFKAHIFTSKNGVSR